VLESSLSYIGLGGNLGEVGVNFERTLAAMDSWADSTLESVSRIYSSPPMGPLDQPDYLNAVAALRTSRSPLDLLCALQGLERDAGRVSGGQRWGARELDLDLLLYDNLQFEHARLQIPHPGLHLRAFVIHPLAEIAPQLVVPGYGSVASIAARTDASTLTVLQAPST
jgi:2-amino-4-hydroxy-6-hydroxymethyldihydropteridine diphosphokinase